MCNFIIRVEAEGRKRKNMRKAIKGERKSRGKEIRKKNVELLYVLSPGPHLGDRLGGESDTPGQGPGCLEHCPGHQKKLKFFLKKCGVRAHS